MTRLPRRLALAGLLCGLAIGTAPAARGQDPNQPPGEVLTRGPVHEAYAATNEQPTAPPVVPKDPPAPVEELPPDQKPEGDNVQWIPGYWSWDEERTDFIWISGFWRVSPPGQVWVPGSWRQVNGGYQWASGFWQNTAPVQQAGNAQPVAPEVEYLPQPPAPIEVGPAVPAPEPTSVYVPGSWVWRGRYLWRPGVWIAYRPGWIWVPAHFKWSPVGYVFVEGYWDYPLARRGVIFAPMYFPPAVVLRPGFVYTPTYVISEPAMVGALFVRRGFGVYYFGDYFGPTYVTAGYTAWCAPALRGTVVVGAGRGYHYDPLWSYYSVTYRSSPAWQTNVTNVYVGRFRGDIPPPPRTLVQQNTVINKITNVNVTNVTNNITVVNNNVNNTTTRNVVVNNHDVTNVAMVAPVRAAAQLQPEARVQKVSPAVVKAEQQHAAEFRQVAARRQQAEVQVAKQHPNLLAPPAKGSDPKTPAPAAQPVRVKLDVPQAMMTRAHSTAPGHTPPPPVPHPKVEPKATTTAPTAPAVTPKTPTTPVTPKVEPKTPVTPKVEPKTPVVPKVEPKTPVTPKVEPKQPTTPVPPVPPKVEPKSPTPPPVTPKVEPKGTTPPVPPKVEPKNTTPPVPPKLEPKLPATPPVSPPVTPKSPTNPTPPPVVPKVEPKTPTTPTPPVTPKVPTTPPPVTPKVEPRPPVVPPAAPKVETPRPPTTPTPPVPPKVPQPAPPTVPKVETPRPVTPPAPKVEPKAVPPVAPKGEAPRGLPTTPAPAAPPHAVPQPRPAGQPAPPAAVPQPPHLPPTPNPMPKGGVPKKEERPHGKG